jgi:hypothetical protein
MLRSSYAAKGNVQLVPGFADAPRRAAAVLDSRKSSLYKTAAMAARASSGNDFGGHEGLGAPR